MRTYCIARELYSVLCGDLNGKESKEKKRGGARGKEPACSCRRHKTCGFDPWVGKIPWRRAWQPTAVFLPGESHGQRSLAGYSQQDHKESDLTEAT